MDPSPWRAVPFAIGLGVRAALVGLLVWAAAEVMIGAHYYATGVVLLGLAGLVVADLSRVTLAGDRTLRALADSLAAGTVERPARTLAAFGELNWAVEQAANVLDAERRAHQERTDELEALLDTVNAALFVLAPDGTLDHSNRAARAMAADQAGRLEDIAAIGPGPARRLTALVPGAREILRLDDGRQMLATAAAFSVPGRARRRLISLQSVSGELDLVELKAWQDLVRILAHEMMNSLTPIVSLTDSLERMMRDEPAPGPEAARQIAAAVQVIGRRSEGLMNFVGRYRRMVDLPAPELAKVRLRDLVDSLGRLIGPMLQDRGMLYRCEVRPPGLTVLADSDLLEQAVLNLLKNAIEAAEGGAGPAIELICSLGLDGGVVIAVNDNGPGLPEDLEGLFVPFFTTKPDGSGIGLSIARQVALAHQGRLLAERRSPRGAVFSMVFPPADGG